MNLCDIHGRCNFQFNLKDFLQSSRFRCTERWYALREVRLVQKNTLNDFLNIFNQLPSTLIDSRQDIQKTQELLHLSTSIRAALAKASSLRLINKWPHRRLYSIISKFDEFAMIPR